MRRVLPMAVVASLLLAMVAGLVQVPGVAEAADTRDVHAWIEVSSVQPGVGCTVDISIEIRESGFAVAQTEVTLALFVGDEVIGTDSAVTDSDGVAYLGVDTSGASVGGESWLDVNVASTYLTGFTVYNTDDGCDGDSKLIEVEGTVSAETVAARSSSDSSSSSESAVRTPASSIWVPTWQQQRNLSCEYAALQIATTALGNGISEYSFDNVVGWSVNPHWGYRGDITGWWGNTSDYGVYAEPLANALSQFGFNGDVFYAGGDSSQLTARIDAGHPTLVWLAMGGDQRTWEETEGVTYTLLAKMHVMVAYGYDADGVYLSDPGSGSYVFYSWDTFMAMWNVLDGMALGVSY
jgi:uncharacterized protein YvpB